MRTLRLAAVAVLLVLSACSIAADDMTVMSDASSLQGRADPDGMPPPAPAPATDADAEGDGAGTTPDPTPDAPTPVAPRIGAVGVGDVYYPTYGNGGYDVLDYDLVIDWDHDARTMEAIATLSLVPTMDLARFNLDLDGLEVRTITVDGRAATFTRDGRELQITPAAPLETGESVTVAILYQGAPRVLESLGAPFSGAGPTSATRSSSPVNPRGPRVGTRSTNTRPTRPPTASPSRPTPT